MAVGLEPPQNLLPVKGVSLATVASGMRYRDRDDLLLMAFVDGAQTAAVFTQNRYCAAPVTVARKHLDTQLDGQSKNNTVALLINAGNANAGTGLQGEADALASCQQVADLLGCSIEQVLPFSTGVIGLPLAMDEFSPAIASAVEQLGDLDMANQADWHAAANAIMTTDTIAKAFSEQLEIEGECVTVTGIAKGSGMICPNMATMLSYIVTDANVSAKLLQTMVEEVSGQSFNRISVDGDTSTNDALTLTATAQVGNVVLDDYHHPDSQKLLAVINAIAKQLAQAIIRDGEGATKFVEINVTGGASQADCSVVAYTVAHSPLVKTALFASDPNWGRILAAIGRSPIECLTISHVDIAVNGVSIIQSGEPDPTYSEERGQTAFAEKDIVIDIVLGAEQTSYSVWTNDLSYDYVRINADYRS